MSGEESRGTWERNIQISQKVDERTKLLFHKWLTQNFMIKKKQNKT